MDLRPSDALREDAAVATGIDFAELTDWLGHDLVSVDLETKRIVYVSPGVRSRLGLDPTRAAAIGLEGEALEGLLRRVFVDADARERAAALLDGRPGDEAALEYRTPAADRERWRRGRFRVVATPSGRRLDYVSEDISDLVESRRAAANAETLRRLTDAVHAAADLPAATMHAAEIVKEHLAVDRCAVVVFDELHGPLGVRSVAGADRPPPPDQLRALVQRILRDHGLSAQFEDLSELPDVPVELVAAMGIRTFAYVAMGAERSPIGAVSVASASPRRFSSEEMAVLHRIGEVLVGPLAQKALEGERRRAQRQVTEAEERLRAALDASSTGIWELETSTDRVRLDERSRALFDLDALEVDRAAVRARIHPDDREGVVRASEAAADPAGPGMFQVEYRHEGSIGPRWLAVRGRYHFADGAPRRFIGTVQDVTELRRLEAKLVAAQKLESLGVLAGGIAHDFNNLLVGVLGNAGLAKLELPPASPVLESIDGIETAALRASELTRQLLAYAGKGRFVISRIDLRQLVQEMGHLLNAVMGKGVVLRYQFGSGVPPVEGDATQLRQVVMNLITNASDAIGERSGIITISTSLIEADRRYLAETLFDEELSPGYYACLQVSDTGVGMDAETQARIFEPFFTTKFTGRGLGLAAVLGILRSHRGSLKVYSEPGRGTTFKVLLPVVDGPPDSPGVRPPEPPMDGSGTILVIDDEDTVRAVTKRVLEQAGYRVLTAVDGVDGVAVFDAHKSEIRAVILDVTMPRMGGEETYRQLRLRSADVRVLLASGYSEQEATSQFAGKALAGFIEKPFRPSDLLAKLRGALEGARARG
jgi:PAS domain S-box-containing protein